GTIEINQAKVLANGGFPYLISTPYTSYRLTGSLSVPASTNGINVNAGNVTIDLNGFSITGPGGSSGFYDGIDASGQSDITVENGTLTGFGTGVEAGSFGIVRNVHADANGGGIVAGSNSVIEGCTANNSTATGKDGIYCTGGCAISGNTANGNPFIGIACVGSGCVISGNTTSSNTTGGINCGGSGCLISGNTVLNNGTGISAVDATSGYGGNVLNGNSTNVFEGTSLGAKNTNLCNGTAC